MKKIYLLMFVFIVLDISISAQSISTNGHSLSLGTSIGLLVGESEEIVYRDTNSDDKLSQLLWDMRPLVYAGVDAYYNWQKPENSWGIFSDALFKFGFSGETGIMEDRDWMDARYADWLTHYSVSDNKTEDAIVIDVNAGVSFKIFEYFLLKPFLSYSYMNFSWTAAGGSFLYPSSDGDHAYLLVARDVGTYKQTWNMISFGLSFYGAFNRHFDIDVSLKLSPSLIWCTAEDNHILRNLEITEELNGGFFIEPNLVFSFTPNDIFKLSFSVAYRNISGLRGDSVYKNNGQIITNMPENIGGAGYSAFNIGIIGRFRILKF
jgi:outer membrane protease